jgi:hypothetical protein
MVEKRQLEVAAWGAAPNPLRHSRARVARPPPRVSPSVIGIFGTLLLHAILLNSIILETRAIKAQVRQVQGSSAIAVGAESDLTLLAVVQPADSKDNFREFISRGSLSQDMSVPLISLDPAPELQFQEGQSSSDQDAESSAQSSDPAGRVRLIGIYSGQIQARIERLWRRPRTPVNDSPDRDATFHCQAEIIQEADGTIKEILLPECNGSAAWQRSLVTAIQQSSPLPAPPSPTVFSNAITLNFTGFEYGPGSAADEYALGPRPLPMQTHVTLPSGSISVEPNPVRVLREPGRNILDRISNGSSTP